MTITERTQFVHHGGNFTWKNMLPTKQFLYSKRKLFHRPSQTFCCRKLVFLCERGDNAVMSHSCIITHAQGSLSDWPCLSISLQSMKAQKVHKRISNCYQFMKACEIVAGLILDEVKFCRPISIFCSFGKSELAG